MRILVWSQRAKPFFYLNDNAGKYIPVPDEIQLQLEQAKTPREVNDVIKRGEPQLAAYAGGEEYLACDVVADLMIAVLRSKGIRAEGVVGYSDEGSFHAWVEVDGKRYDPTGQGCWTTPPKVDPRTGYFIHRGELAKKYGFGYLERAPDRR